MAEKLIIRIKLHNGQQVNHDQQANHDQQDQVPEEDSTPDFKPLIAKIVAAIIVVVAIISIVLPNNEATTSQQVTAQKNQTVITQNQKIEVADLSQDQAVQNTVNLAKPVPTVALDKKTQASDPAYPKKANNPASPQEVAKTKTKPQKTESITSTDITGQFTSGIKKLKPVDNLGSQIKPLKGKFTRSITYYTVIKNQKGKKLTHKWEQNGKQRASITSQITQNRQVMYSSKKITKNMTGEWKVSVIDDDGKIMQEDRFNFIH